MSAFQKIRQKLIKEPESNHPFKRDVIILLAFTAAPAFGERRVTTTIGNTLSANTCSDDSCYKKQPITPQDIQVPKSWKKLLDPNQMEFWNEGNHVPDAGFVEWATNPTLENAKLYLIRMNAKRDRLHVMVKQQEQANKELIAAGVIANDYDFLAERFSSNKPKENRLSDAILDQSTGHIWFYFHPACPHCKRQAEILKGSSNVSPIQVGGETLHNFQGLQKSLWAEEDDLKRYVPDGQVPVLIIYNPKTNKLASLKGVQSIAAINKVATTIGTEDAKKGGTK